MKPNKRSLLEKMAYFVTISYLGLQILGDIGDAFDTGNRIIGEQRPSVAWLLIIFLIPIVGWAFDEIRRFIGEEKEALSKPTGKAPNFLSKLLSGISEAVRKKPWWFVTLFVTLSALSLFSLDLPDVVLVLVTLITIVVMAISVSYMVLSIANGAKKTTLELSILSSVFSIVLFFGLLTLQTPSLNKIINSIPSVTLFSPEDLQSGQGDDLNKESFIKLPLNSEFLNSVLEGSRDILLAFVVLGAMVGMVFNTDSPIAGAILGGVGGGLVGLVLGPVATLLIDNGLIGLHKILR